MTGIEIQYLLGLFFAIKSIVFVSGKFTANAFLLIVGVVLIVMSIIGFSPIR